MRYLLPRIEHLPLWPTISGLVFLLLFLVLIWWTYRKDRKHLYDAVAKLPFEDERSEVDSQENH